MAYNNNFSNFHPYYTPTSFSDITNPAYPNFNQPSVPEWSYPNEYNPCLPSYDHNFHNNFNSNPSFVLFEAYRGIGRKACIASFPEDHDSLWPLLQRIALRLRPRFSLTILYFDTLCLKKMRRPDSFVGSSSFKNLISKLISRSNS